MWALYFDDQQASKWHKHKLPAIVEAFERKIVVNSAIDFAGDIPETFLISPWRLVEKDDE